MTTPRLATADDLRALARQQYVLLTTFRRDGSAVATPVWVAAEGADAQAAEAPEPALVVITAAATGKVKRLRHTPRVLLTVCDRAGKVAPDAEELEAIGLVEDSEDVYRRAQGLVIAKYGFMARVIAFMARRRARRAGQHAGAVVRVAVAGAPA